jgi:hypothetical protein
MEVIMTVWRVKRIFSTHFGDGAKMSSRNSGMGKTEYENDAFGCGAYF